ncbi:GntR family transcriptional regulator [Kineococcus rhizosphaerae]|uniref:GntR family transcriptional regulator n=1 Tax=Kineococcus rhizosphaerae TaxID=559628 RepID=A0A2T0QXA5_9ACTN|nr:GntR family transcriptional regulator [Kineococcus rhizosphaerae]PRY10523.1 GntR family transcriptional regulator [Kineococcus rhizosphaerae]
MASSASEGNGVVSRRIAERLRELILDGHLQPGQRIVQDELAAEFGTSRLPVREALRILESSGLVRLRSSSGAWVTSMDTEAFDIAYKIRERIEPLALAESVPHLTDDDVVRLEELQAAIEDNDDVEVFLRLDRELHWLTYSRSTSAELTLLAERYWDTTQFYRRAFAMLAGQDRRWVINAEHRLLIDAVRRRDAESAEHVLAGHIKRTRIELMRHPDLFTS